MSYMMHSNLFKTKLTVRTSTPEVTYLTTSADEARIALIANSSNFNVPQSENNKNYIFYIGTTTCNNEAYIGIDDNNTKTINKVATFNRSEIKFNLPTTVKGNLMPSLDAVYDLGSELQPWSNLYLSGSDLYFSEALIHYDKHSNELQFLKERIALEYDTSILIKSNIEISSNYTESSNYLAYSNAWLTSNYDALVSILVNKIDVTYTEKTEIETLLLPSDESPELIKTLETSNLNVTYNLISSITSYYDSNVITSSNYIQNLTKSYTSNFQYTSNETRLDRTDIQYIETTGLTTTEINNIIFSCNNDANLDESAELVTEDSTTKIKLSQNHYIETTVTYYIQRELTSNETLASSLILDTCNVTIFSQTLPEQEYQDLLGILLDTTGLSIDISKSLIASNITLISYIQSSSNLSTSNILITSNELQNFSLLEYKAVPETSDVIIDIDGVPTTISIHKTSNIILTKHVVTSNIDVTGITDTQLIQDLLYYDASFIIPNSHPPVPEITKVLLTSNIPIVTEVYRKYYDPLSIMGKHIALINADGSYAEFSTSTGGTFLNSYSMQGDTVSELKLTDFTTANVPEEYPNLYYTYERTSNMLMSINTETATAITNTSNNIASMVRDNYIELTGEADRIQANTESSLLTYVVTLQSNLTADTSALLIQIQNTSNELTSNITKISSDITLGLTLSDLDTSNYVSRMSNDIIKIIQNSSNDIINALRTNDRSFNDYMITTSNLIYTTTLSTSNTIVDYIRQTDISTSNYIDQSSNNLRLSIIQMYDDLTRQSSNADIISSNILRQTADDLQSNITARFKNISDDILAKDVMMSNYVYDVASNMASNIEAVRKNITDRIGSLTLQDIANGTINKVIVDGIYPYDLTVSNLTTVGNVVPMSDGVYDLGSPENRWKDLYLAGDSIYMDNVKMSAKSSPPGFVIKKADDSGYVDLVVSKIVLKDVSTPNLVEIKNEGGNVTIGTYVAEQVSGSSGGGTSTTSGTALKAQETTSSIIEGTSNLYFTFERAGKIAYASNLNLYRYADNVSNSVSTRINNLTADQIANGTSNKFIVNGIYDSDLTINGTLTVSNLNVIGDTTSINTITYTTERLKINTDQSDGPALTAIQLSTCNLAEFYYQSTKVFTITSDGFIGIGSGTPTCALDVEGNIKFTDSINGITANEISFLEGLKSPVQGQINFINENSSNATSNLNVVVMQRLNDSSNLLDNAITSSNSMMIDYIYNTSNQFGVNFTQTSNNLKNLIIELNSNMESNLLLNVSNVFNIAISKVNDDVNDRITSFNTNAINYVMSTSNMLQSNITNTSDTISNRIQNILTTGWLIGAGDSNLYFQNNVGIGTTDPKQKLHVVGNIKFSGSINNVTSNEFRFLSGAASNIQNQIDTITSGLYVYTSNTSNSFELLMKDTSNTLVSRMLRLTSDVYDYVSLTSNTLETRIRDTSNNLSKDINAYLAGGTLSQWTNGAVGTASNFIYFNQSVGIGTTQLLDASKNKLEVYGGDILIVEGQLTRTTNGITEPYQYLRWKDSSTYLEAGGNKFIYYEGYVGIGTIPDNTAVLNVAGGSASVSSITASEFDSQYATIQIGKTSAGNLCAIFDSSIWCKESVIVTSDERIKKNLQDINDDTALQKIMSIQPKTYNYIDPKKGTEKVYGFLAQQIREVIPEAVDLQKDIVPDIFTVADCALNVITMPANIAIDHLNNSNLCIIDMTGNYGMYTVNAVDTPACTITIDRSIATNKVFVYGTEVNDFHTLDKSYIFTLNVCATQELARQLDQVASEVEQLENVLGISATDYMTHIGEF